MNFASIIFISYIYLYVVRISDMTEQCPNFTTIHLHDCQWVHYLNIQSDKLQSVTISACPEITSLALDSPALSAFSVNGCLRLASVVVKAGEMLQSAAIVACGRLEKVEIVSEGLQQLRMLELMNMSSVALTAPSLRCILWVYYHQLHCFIAYSTVRFQRDVVIATHLNMT